MTWNYRVIQNTKDDEDFYYIKEVYYDQDGNIKLYSEDSIAPHGLTYDELREDLEMMLNAFNYPIITGNELIELFNKESILDSLDNDNRDDDMQNFID
mgnify:FL=1